MKRRIHAAADRYEPKLARAFVKSARNMRERLDLDHIEKALIAGDVQGAVDSVEATIKGSLSPAAEVLRDAFFEARQWR